MLSTYSTASMFENQAGPRFAYDAFLLKAGSGADRCTKCAECEPKCPQNIPIIEMLAQAHAHLTGSCQIGSQTPARTRVDRDTPFS